MQKQKSLIPFFEKRVEELRSILPKNTGLNKRCDPRFLTETLVLNEIILERLYASANNSNKRSNRRAEGSVAYH